MIAKIMYFLWPIAAINYLLVRLRYHLFDLGIWKSVEFELPTYYIGGITCEKSWVISQLVNDVLQQNNVNCGLHVKSDEISSCDLKVIEGDHVYYSSLSHVSMDSVQSHYLFSTNNKVIGVSEFLQKNTEVSCLLFNNDFMVNEIRPDFKILIASFDRPFDKELFHPVGKLKDRKLSASSADVVLIVDCPLDASVVEVERKLLQYLKNGVSMFFIRKTDMNEGALNSSDRIEIIKDRDNFERLILGGLKKVESN